MPPKFLGRPNRRTSRARSIASDASFTPPPIRRQRSTIADSTILNSLDISPFSQQDPQKSATKLPPYYTLPPTVPSPFSGTLEASLDAILSWGRLCPSLKSVQHLVSTLLEDVNPNTNWVSLLGEVYSTTTITPQQARYLITELLFLLTRTLLPEQITENRAALGRLYEHRKQLAIRLVLRYDMLREWKMESGQYHRDQPVAVASVPPKESGGDGAVLPSLVPAAYPERYPFRRPLLSNVIPTLIAAPPGGFTTHGVRERMKHHVTDLDAYLVLRDEEVEEWSISMLDVKTCFALLHWQWLRQNNAMLEDMEIHAWEELEGRADECEWIADDVKRMGTGISTKKEAKTLE